MTAKVTATATATATVVAVVSEGLGLPSVEKKQCQVKLQKTDILTESGAYSVSYDVARGPFSA